MKYLNQSIQQLLLAVAIILIFSFKINAQPPLFDQWESNMVEYGQKWGDILMAYSEAELTSPVARNNVYYDGQRIFFQIADYTGDAEPWNSYAQRAEVIYRDKYAIPNNYGVQGYRRFSHGLYMDAVRTNDDLSAEGVFLMRDKPPFSNPETFGNVHKWYWSGLSREIAYAIESHVISEQIGHQRLEERMALYIDMALNHIHEWTTGEYGSPNVSNNRLAPFMVGLTAEALITDYEWSVTQGKVADTRIPAALKAVADYLMVAQVRDGPNVGANMWIENLDNSGYGAFRYEDAELSPTGTKPAPVLNLLIAPMYAWLYKHYGEQSYLEMGDKIFAGGVRLAEGSLDWSGKQYNQNYRWSFDYIKWRNEGMVLSVAGIKDANKISTYPNPVKDKLTINALEQPIESYKIYTVNGQVIQSDSLVTKNQVNTSSLIPGVYLLEFIANQKTVIIKFIKE
ncbi:MAG: T9SS type A sorting domain-containing protein [Cyclobacteriaceae bacterium]|nr:T9SS type A sorting domain-containing protein [Cyclobacteriaceae bacterium]